MPLRPVRTLLAVVAAAALFQPGSSRAEQFLTVNPGVTLSYTFGHGFTYGLELSWVWMPTTLEEFKAQPFGRGVAIDLSTNFRDLTKIRAAGEIIGPFIGVEAGPALVFDSRGAHLAVGITPWAGWHVMPYYTYTLVFGGENLHEIGSYLKLYLDPSGENARSSRGDDWD